MHIQYKQVALVFPNGSSKEQETWQVYSSLRSIGIRECARSRARDALRCDRVEGRRRYARRSWAPFQLTRCAPDD